MTDRVPGAPGRCKAVVAGEELQKLQAGEEFAITLRRDDQPIKAGTPYSKAAVLPDELAASLCPGVQDPAPKDAFAALHTQKADTVRQASGRDITLRDATHTPLKSLKLYGQGSADGCVGDGGSVMVKVSGKNLADSSVLRGASGITESDGVFSGEPHPFYIATKGGLVSETFSEGQQYTFSVYAKKSNAASHPYIIIKHTDGTAIGPDILSTSDFERVVAVSAPGKTVASAYITYGSGESSTVYIKDIQIERGAVATEYEPYVEPQTITVPTPNGLAGDDSARDEIDFAKGVLIRRCGEQSEERLPHEVLEAYAKLHTYAPTTVITNDAGAEMEVTYYTPSTAVQMVHSPADKGKILSIDEHGCVVLAPNEVGSVKETFPVDFGKGTTTTNGVKKQYYTLDISDYNGNSHLCGKTLRIKTYAYGDMKYTVTVYTVDGTELEVISNVINPDADITKDPKSGVCEFEIHIPWVNFGQEVEVNGDTHILDTIRVDIDFEDNPYTELEAHEKKDTVWGEIKTLSDNSIMGIGEIVFNDYSCYWRKWNAGYAECLISFDFAAEDVTEDEYVYLDFALPVWFSSEPVVIHNILAYKDGYPESTFTAYAWFESAYMHIEGILDNTDYERIRGSVYIVGIYVE